MHSLYTTRLYSHTLFFKTPGLHKSCSFLSSPQVVGASPTSENARGACSTKLYDMQSRAEVETFRNRVSVGRSPRAAAISATISTLAGTSSLNKKALNPSLEEALCEGSIPCHQCDGSAGRDPRFWSPELSPKPSTIGSRMVVGSCIS